LDFFFVVVFNILVYYEEIEIMEMDRMVVRAENAGVLKN